MLYYLSLSYKPFLYSNNIIYENKGKNIIIPSNNITYIITFICWVYTDEKKIEKKRDKGNRKMKVNRDYRMIKRDGDNKCFSIDEMNISIIIFLFMSYVDRREE